MIIKLKKRGVLMILDGHIHIRYEDINGEDFLGKLKEAKIEGGVIISKPLILLNAASISSILKKG